VLKFKRKFRRLNVNAGGVSQNCGNVKVGEKLILPKIYYFATVIRDKSA
jgi:hypothetical protein